MKKSLILIIIVPLILIIFSNVALAQGGPPPVPPVVITFTNPITYDTVEEFLGGLLNALQGIIVTIAMIFMLVGAIMYMTSSGNEKRLEKAKKALTAAVVGLALGVAAPSFFKEIYIVLGWTPTAGPSFGTSLSLTEVVRRALDFLLSIVGVLSLIMLVFGGMMYMTGGGSLVGDKGSEKHVSAGKNIVKYAIIGMAVAWGSLVIVNWLGNFFTP